MAEAKKPQNQSKGTRAKKGSAGQKASGLPKSYYLLPKRKKGEKPSLNDPCL